jgi:Rha family phage regulatory protein
MDELTIIKHNGSSYIDSREVAEIIGKKHQHLLRDIRGYAGILAKGGLSNLGQSDFFIESSFINAQNKPMPCYLLSKSGCELVANKLIGEKGVLFTAAYVAKFNRMEQAEREQLAKQAVTPKLAVFNKAIRTVIGGLNAAGASANTVLAFLQDSYRPFGIPVAETGDDSRFYSASVVARALGVYSHSGRPHAHAISAIIDKLDIDLGGHIEIAPYGLVGFSLRYDAVIAEAVQEWLITRGKPHNIPHNGFEYHIWYEGERSAFCDNGGGDCDDEEIDLDDDGDAISAYLRTLSMDELNELCEKYDECDICHYLGYCPGTYDID